MAAMFRANFFLIQDLLLVAGLLASCCLFLALKREIQRHGRRYQAALREIEELLPKLRAAALERAEWKERPGDAMIPAPASAVVRSGLNVQTRVQAVRMLRRGEDVAHVSAALGVARGEIELLIRVHRLSAGRVASAGRAASAGQS